MRIVFCSDVEGQDEVEVRYLFVREHWHQGLAIEAVQGVMDYAREKFGFKRLIAMIRNENRSSIQVAERCGLKPEKEIMRKGYKHIVYVSEQK